MNRKSLYIVGGLLSFMLLPFLAWNGLVQQGNASAFDLLLRYGWNGHAGWIRQHGRYVGRTGRGHDWRWRHEWQRRHGTDGFAQVVSPIFRWRSYESNKFDFDGYSWWGIDYP